MDSIISVDHVSMTFRINTSRTSSLKEWFIAKVKGRLRYEIGRASCRERV